MAGMTSPFSDAATLCRLDSLLALLMAASS
jgi:hypothetical protein